MDIDKVINDLSKELASFFDKKYSHLKPELEQDLTVFLERAKGKMKRWILLLSTESITQEEFQWLLDSQKDLLVMQALQLAGVSKIKLNEIKKSVFKIVFDTVVKALVLLL